MAVYVPTTKSVNRAQASHEMSSNPHELRERSTKESLFERFSLKLDKRFNIERLKVLGATTFVGTINLANVEK